VIPRPYGPAVHASIRNSVLHFDYLQIDLSRKKQFKYLFVVRDDLSSFTELFPCLNPTAAFAAECLLDWITRYGIPSVFVSDRGSHFLNSLIEELCLKLHINHHFTLAYCPWSNGTVEVINRHILFVLRSLISELRLDFMDWPVLIPLVRFTLNHSVLSSRPAAVTLFMALPPSSPLDSIFNPRTKSLVSVMLTNTELESLVHDLQESLQKMHKGIEENRSSRREAANARRQIAKLPNFSLGDYVLMSNVLNVRKHKLEVRWIGPFQIIAVKSDYIFTIKNLISEKTSDCHCSRLRFYCDSDLNVTEEILKQFAHDGNAFEIEDVLDARFNPRTKVWEVLVKWTGFESIEDSWEPVLQLLKDCPVFIKRRLRGREFCPPDLARLLDDSP
jgi:hypothetical protein